MLKFQAGPGETADELKSLKLKIIQKEKGYRFSIDAVLLADFAAVKRKDRVMDIGTGCGIVSMIIARRKPCAKIVGLEIQKSLASIAMRNVILNGFEGLVEIVGEDLRNVREILVKESFDIVVSNPPFRSPACGAVSPVPEKAFAKHQIEGTIEDLLGAAKYLLPSRGRLALIYPASLAGEIIHRMKERKIEPQRLKAVHYKRGMDASLILIEGRVGARVHLKIENPLFLYDERGVPQEEFKRMYEIA